MKKRKSLYHGHRFPAAVISLAVRWYFRFQLSLRDIEELLFERGVVVSYERSGPIRMKGTSPSRGCGGSRESASKCHDGVSNYINANRRGSPCQ
ncbi:IS6 family transposase, partial [Paraburkholderia sp. BR10936]